MLLRLGLQITAGLADGSIDLVVGTHALIADAVTFQSLGLAIVDEQHRWAHYVTLSLATIRHNLVWNMV